MPIVCRSQLLLLLLTLLPFLTYLHAASPPTPFPLLTLSTLPCQVSTSSGTSHFDLTPLRGKSHYWSAYDLDTLQRKGVSTYSYHFNVCKNVPPPGNNPKCTGILDANQNRTAQQAPAWQVSPPFPTDGSPASVNYTMKSCNRLGGSVVPPGGEHFSASWGAISTEWRLLHEYDSSKGLSLKYLDGAPCSSGVNRTFTINFICADTSRGVEPSDSKNLNQFGVDEGDSAKEKCHYTVEFVSKFACPSECVYGAKDLMCNGGYCGYDRSIDAPRCFCEKGKYGSDCSLEAPKPATCTGGLCLMLVFTIILLVILLIIGCILYWKVSQIIEQNRALGLSQNENDTKTNKKSNGKRKNARESSSQLNLQDEDGDEPSVGPDGSSEEPRNTSNVRQTEIELPSRVGQQHQQPHHQKSLSIEHLDDEEEIDLEADEEDMRAL